MESALYDPREGYYPTRDVNQDFYTAPELHPSFGWVLARQIVGRLTELKRRGIPGPYSVVEMGSGSGLLARQILETWQNEFPDWAGSIRYILVEKSQERLLESVIALSPLRGRILGYSGVEDLTPCAGVFFSNELVDSFPFHVLERRGGRVLEVFVDASGQQRLGRLSCPELRPIAERLASSLPEGGRHAVNLEARKWVRTISEKMARGYLITIDYGKRFGAASSAEHRRGLPGQAVRLDCDAAAFKTGRLPGELPSNPPRSFYRHTTGPEMTRDKGRRDITASADFEDLIRVGARHGLALESYSTLGRYLLDAGIADWISIAPKGNAPPDSLAAFKDRSRIKTLIHPEGMGETFKVLVQSQL